MTIQEILRSNDSIPVILAPMAGVTDLSFREICMMHGCSFTYSEMISVKALSFNNKKTFRLMENSDRAKPFGIQLFGHEPQLIGDIVKLLSTTYGSDISLIDLNMGCPAPKIVNNGDGCALMKDELLASKVIEYAKKNSTVPITVKFRMGWDEHSINALNFAKMAEDSGADAVAVHGRTRNQMYSGNANWDIIAEIKQKLRIPVIGNGDIKDAESAESMRKKTSCDALLIGRAAQGNPFIFEEIKAHFEGREYNAPTINERIDTALLHAELHNSYKGDIAFPEMRKHLAWYSKGIKGAAQLRERIFKCSSCDEAAEIMNLLKNQLL